jgi:hypothetical protein
MGVTGPLVDAAQFGCPLSTNAAACFTCAVSVDSGLETGCPLSTSGVDELESDCPLSITNFSASANCAALRPNVCASLAWRSLSTVHFSSSGVDLMLATVSTTKP